MISRIIGSSRAREFHPLTEPCVKVSPHTALHTQLFVIDKTLIYKAYLKEKEKKAVQALTRSALKIMRKTWATASTSCGTSCT